VLVMSEFLPNTIFRINPNRSLRFFAVPLLLLYLLLYPISQFTSWLSMVLMKLFGIKNEKNEIRLISVGELDDYLQENIDKSEDENREVEREVKLFENALDFSDTRLRDCMIPRNEIVGVDIAETSREELSKLFTRSGLSKLVVYHDDIDNVLGFIQVSEMFKPNVNWKDQIKPVIIAPETMLAKKMMQNLLKEKKSMAIVVDEFGGTAGMVTLEDLVEEIFGDIEDEHDRRKLGIEIHSGKNRIVRRIFESLGYEVRALDRVYFAGLTKKGLKKGEWRYLTDSEVSILRMGAFL
jgi:CBS domain containing-hemolysin-like protein